MNSKETLWLRLMEFGNRVGCHQRPDRSFFFHHYQFPFCARCTGLIVGQFILYPFLLLFHFHGNSLIYIICLGLMFLDWVLQALGWVNSTNLRRFLTGILGGYALIAITVQIAINIYHFVN